MVYTKYIYFCFLSFAITVIIVFKTLSVGTLKSKFCLYVKTRGGGFSIVPQFSEVSVATGIDYAFSW